MLQGRIYSVILLIAMIMEARVTETATKSRPSLSCSGVAFSYWTLRSVERLNGDCIVFIRGAKHISAVPDGSRKI
jgi:hypothetical protein